MQASAERPDSKVRLRAVELVTVRLLAAMTLYVVVTSVGMVIRHHIRVPFWDQWVAVLPGEYLARPFAQHNEHRILFGRLFFALDTWLAAGSGGLSLAVVLLSLGATAALLAVASGSGPRGKLPGLVVFALSLTLLFAAYAWECLLWSFQASYVGVLPFAVGAFVAFGAGGERRRGLIVAAVCAVSAAYSLASGMMVAPLLFAFAILARRPRREAVVLFLLSYALAVSYAWDYERPGQHADPRSSLGDPVAILRYLTVYLGAPFSFRFAEDRLQAANVLGWIGLGAWLALWAFLLRRRNTRTTADWILPFVSVFAVGWGSMTAAGRANFPLDQALSSRYGTPALLFWCAMAAEGLRAANALPARIGASALALLMAGELTYQQQAHVAFGSAHYAFLRDAETALATGALEAAVIDRVSPSVGWVTNALPELRERRLTLFREPWVEWLGKPVESLTERREKGACLGTLEHATAVPAYGGPAYRVDGWAYSLRSAGPVERVLLVDERGIVIGLALGGHERPDVSKAHAAVRSDRSGFVGHVGTLAAPSVNVHAVALVGDGRTACPLEGTALLTRAAAEPLVK